MEDGVSLRIVDLRGRIAPFQEDEKRLHRLTSSSFGLAVAKAQAAGGQWMMADPLGRLGSELSRAHLAN